MPKIELEKNTWIDDIRVDFAQGGFWTGALMLQINFSGGVCPSTEFLARVLALAGAQKLPKRKIVRLSGMFAPNDPDIGKLVLMLHSHGYNVQVVLHDLPAIGWLPYASWIIYRTSATLVPMAFNELWYEPPEVGVIPEVVLPEPLRDPKTGVPQAQLLYLKRAGAVTIVTKFVCESAQNWQLL